MIEIIWDEKFKRIYKKWSKSHPDLVEQFRNRMELFADSPFHPSLKTHSLSGVLKGSWAFRISYEHRLKLHPPIAVATSGKFVLSWFTSA